jgi:hypothetical protein
VTQFNESPLYCAKDVAIDPGATATIATASASASVVLLNIEALRVQKPEAAFVGWIVTRGV